MVSLSYCHFSTCSYIWYRLLLMLLVLLHVYAWPPRTLLPLEMQWWLGLKSCRRIYSWGSDFDDVIATCCERMKGWAIFQCNFSFGLCYQISWQAFLTDKVGQTETWDGEQNPDERRCHIFYLNNGASDVGRIENERDWSRTFEFFSSGSKFMRDRY